jgi:hypothetical protein
MRNINKLISKGGRAFCCHWNQFDMYTFELFLRWWEEQPCLTGMAFPSTLSYHIICWESDREHSLQVRREPLTSRLREEIPIGQCWITHRVPTPLLSSCMCSEGMYRNHLNEEITPFLPTGIGEWYSKTISNLGHAALLRQCDLPYEGKC